MVTWKERFLSEGIALVALNYHAPLTLVNTLRTWNSTGLLNMVSERLMILNDPFPQELAMATEHGFQILQPNDIPNVQVAHAMHRGHTYMLIDVHVCTYVCIYVCIMRFSTYCRHNMCFRCQNRM
jgi:hypothetical protein